MDLIASLSGGENQSGETFVRLRGLSAQGEESLRGRKGVNFYSWEIWWTEGEIGRKGVNLMGKR